MLVPEIEHPTDRPNFTRVDVGDMTYWFSYKTCVAFSRHDGFAPVVRENVWGPTTGKHLNHIDGGGYRKANRVDAGLFKALLDANAYDAYRGKGV